MTTSLLSIAKENAKTLSPGNAPSLDAAIRLLFLGEGDDARERLRRFFANDFELNPNAFRNSNTYFMLTIRNVVSLVLSELFDSNGDLLPELRKLIYDLLSDNSKNQLNAQSGPSVDDVKNRIFYGVCALFPDMLPTSAEMDEQKIAATRELQFFMAIKHVLEHDAEAITLCDHLTAALCQKTDVGGTHRTWHSINATFDSRGVTDVTLDATDLTDATLTRDAKTSDRGAMIRTLIALLSRDTSGGFKRIVNIDDLIDEAPSTDQDLPDASLTKTKLAHLLVGRHGFHPFVDTDSAARRTIDDQVAVPAKC